MHPRYSSVRVLVPGESTTSRQKDTPIVDEFEDSAEVAALEQLDGDLTITEDLLRTLDAFSPPTPRRGQPLGSAQVPFPYCLAHTIEEETRASTLICLVTPPTSPRSTRLGRIAGGAAK